MQDGKAAFRRGLADGVPIMLGYFTVSIALGVVMANLGISVFAGGLMSFTNMTSAGQFAATDVIANQSGYLLMALITLVINARYILMSCALSQRLEESVSLPMRMLLGMTVTDEIFGITIAREERYINPLYSFGALCVACPGWTMGTVCGAVLGNVLPDRVLSALGVALFAMLIAVFLPAAKGDKIVAGTVVVAMAASFVLTKIPVTAALSDGARILILTIVIAGLAAVFFPRDAELD